MFNVQFSGEIIKKREIIREDIHTLTIYLFIMQKKKKKVGREWTRKKKKKINQ